MAACPGPAAREGQRRGRGARPRRDWAPRGRRRQARAAGEHRADGRGDRRGGSAARPGRARVRRTGGAVGAWTGRDHVNPSICERVPVRVPCRWPGDGATAGARRGQRGVGGGRPRADGGSAAAWVRRGESAAGAVGATPSAERSRARRVRCGCGRRSGCRTGTAPVRAEAASGRRRRRGPHRTIEGGRGRGLTKERRDATPTLGRESAAGRA